MFALSMEQVANTNWIKSQINYVFEFIFKEKKVYVYYQL